MLGLCDATYCTKKSDGYIETEFITHSTGIRFIAHIDLCKKHGHLIPIQIREDGAISIDNVNTTENPLYAKYWKVIKS